MNLKHQWQPVSSTAYGANAVYIPEYGKARTLEFILVMTQNYPEFKTHPALDIFHGYISGAERFEKNHEMRVLGWEIKPDQAQWSFLYLPTLRNDIQVLATFSANTAGRMRMEISMENPSDENRQWEFCLYVNPCEGLELPDCSCGTLEPRQCAFRLNGIDMLLKPENIVFKDISETDSNFWINFPFNAECSEDPCNPQKRCKKRLKIRMKHIDIPAGSYQTAAIDFFPDKSAQSSPPPPKFKLSEIPDNELPYRHAIWEALHNRQYTKSFTDPEKMTIHHIPARQWGKFFIWDGGMTAVGLADSEESRAAEIISQMPDPDRTGEEAYNYGSFIITAVYALWELYRNTGNIDYIKKHYPLLKKLVLHMFDSLPGENYNGMAAANRGTGADDSPALFYAKGEIFAWDYKKTLPVNPDRKKKSLICIGMTAHAVRELKILRIFAFLSGNKADIKELTAQIETSEKELNDNYWSDVHKCYLDRVIDEDNLLDIPWIYDYLPLFSGSAPQARQEMLFEGLLNDGYLSENGLTILKPDSPYYRQDGYPNGSLWPPLQYLFWKACYCMGEMNTAKNIAEKFFHVFEKNHRETLSCWEQFRAASGKGAGNSRFSGFVTPIFAMWKAHHKYGSIQTSYDILLQKREITQTECKLVLHSPFYSGKTGFSVVLKPETRYLVTINDMVNIAVNSDRFGWLGIAFNIKGGHEYKLKIINCRS
jgi:hypothetical protein